MEIKKYYIIFCLFFYIAANTFHYDIKLYNVSMSNVVMMTQDTIVNKDLLTKISFETSTYKLISTFFEIDNKYQTIIDSNFNIKSFQKDTYQPNVSNKIFTINRNDSIFYNNSQLNIPKNYFNIFSLLYYLSITDFKQIKSNVKLEREGLQYDCKIEKVKTTGHLYEYTLTFKLVEKDRTPLFIQTDIFTWAIFKENAIRTVIVDPNLKKIVKCTFKNGWNKLEAHIK